MLVIIVLIIILIFILLPLPIKVSVVYDNRLFAIKVYNHKINLQNKKDVERNTEKALSMDINIKPIATFLIKNRFKPSAKLRFKLAYGFGDAAYTGISYGIIQASFPFILEYAKNFIKIKNTELNINPEFDKSVFNLEINSIFFISLVQVIYIGVNILSIFKKNHIYKRSC